MATAANYRTVAVGLLHVENHYDYANKVSPINLIPTLPK